MKRSITFTQCWNVKWVLATPEVQNFCFCQGKVLSYVRDSSQVGKHAQTHAQVKSNLSDFWSSLALPSAVVVEDELSMTKEELCLCLYRRKKSHNYLAQTFRFRLVNQPIRSRNLSL